MPTNTDIARQVIQCLSGGELSQVADYFADELSIEMVFANKGLPSKITGKSDALSTLTAFISSTFKKLTFHIHTSYECADPEVVVMEATSLGIISPGAKFYQNRYVFVFGFCKGKIITWREYFDPYRTSLAGFAANQDI